MKRGFALSAIVVIFLLSLGPAAAPKGVSAGDSIATQSAPGQDPQQQAVTELQRVNAACRVILGSPTSESAARADARKWADSVKTRPWGDVKARYIDTGKDEKGAWWVRVQKYNGEQLVLSYDSLDATSQQVLKDIWQLKYSILRALPKPEVAPQTVKAELAGTDSLGRNGGDAGEKASTRPGSAESEKSGALMVPRIGGNPGRLGPYWVVEAVWAKDELIVSYYPEVVADGNARKLLLKGADTTHVADGFIFESSRDWRVTGKQTYETLSGATRSILVAEALAVPRAPEERNDSKPKEACRDPLLLLCGREIDRALGGGQSRVVQILNDHEMLVTMGTVAGYTPRMVTVLLRGVDATKLTEDSYPPYGVYLVNGTYQYKAVDGALRTVFVVKGKEDKKP